MEMVLQQRHKRTGFIFTQSSVHSLIVRMAFTTCPPLSPLRPPPPYTPTPQIPTIIRSYPHFRGAGDAHLGNNQFWCRLLITARPVSHAHLLANHQRMITNTVAGQPLWEGPAQGWKSPPICWPAGHVQSTAGPGSSAKAEVFCVISSPPTKGRPVAETVNSQRLTL